MKIIANTTDFYLEKGTAVAIGKFDGVHIGHRRLLEEVLAQKERGLLACVFTFDPAPSEFFGYSDGKELTTPEEKRRIFAQMGVDVLVEFPMNRETAGMSPDKFLEEILIERLHMRMIAAGKDLSFGYRGAGNVAFLEQMSDKWGYEVRIIDKILLQEIEVSSTYVRGLVKDGRMETVKQCLGMPYSVSGQVVHGNHIGTGLGFPTVNLVPSEDKILPPNGVYYSYVCVQDKLYRAITNIGYKPTVAGEKKIGIESYLYDFARDIYGQEITVSLLSYKRPERQFADLQELKRQLERDIAEGAQYIPTPQK